MAFRFAECRRHWIEALLKNFYAGSEDLRVPGADALGGDRVAGRVGVSEESGGFAKLRLPVVNQLNIGRIGGSLRPGRGVLTPVMAPGPG